MHKLKNIVSKMSWVYTTPTIVLTAIAASVFNITLKTINVEMYLVNQARVVVSNAASWLGRYSYIGNDTMLYVKKIDRELAAWPWQRSDSSSKIVVREIKMRDCEFWATTYLADLRDWNETTIWCVKDVAAFDSI